MFEWSRMEKEKQQIRLLRDKYQEGERPGVSIILPTSKPKYLENIFENLQRIQYPEVEYLVIINNSRVNPQVYHERFREFKGIRFLALDEGYTLGDCLNYGVDLAKYDYIGKMDDDDYYGAFFLEDLMLAFHYTYAQIVGKGVHFVFFEANHALGVRLPIAIPYSITEGAFYENRYTRGPSLAGGTFIVKREVFNKVRFQSVNLGEDIKFLQDCTKKEISIYSADRYNYVYKRHGDRMDHTWNVNSLFVQRQSHIMDQSGDFVPIITV